MAQPRSAAEKQRTAKAWQRMAWRVHAAAMKSLSQQWHWSALFGSGNAWHRTAAARRVAVMRRNRGASQGQGKEPQPQATALQDTASQGEGIVRKRKGEAWRREAVE